MANTAKAESVSKNTITSSYVRERDKLNALLKLPLSVQNKKTAELIYQRANVSAWRDKLRDVLDADNIGIKADIILDEIDKDIDFFKKSPTHTIIDLQSEVIITTQRLYGEQFGIYDEKLVEKNFSVTRASEIVNNITNDIFVKSAQDSIDSIDDTTANNSFPDGSITYEKLQELRGKLLQQKLTKQANIKPGIGGEGISVKKNSLVIVGPVVKQAVNSIPGNLLPAPPIILRPSISASAGNQKLRPVIKTITTVPETNDVAEKLSENLIYPSSNQTQLLNIDKKGFDYRKYEFVVPWFSDGNGKPSYFSLLKITGSDYTPKVDSVNLPTIEDPFAGGKALYNQFFMNSIAESNNEKFDIVDTMSEGEAFFAFGSRPEIWTFTGSLINDKINNWLGKFREIWHSHIRASVLVENGQYLKITIPTISLTCNVYPIGLTIYSTADNEVQSVFSMSTYVRSWQSTSRIYYDDFSTLVADELLKLSGITKSPNLGSVTTASSISSSIGIGV